MRLLNCSALAYNYGYWLAGYVATGPAEIIRLTSTVRAVEAAGGAVAAGISSTPAPVSGPTGSNEYVLTLDVAHRCVGGQFWSMGACCGADVLRSEEDRAGYA